MIPFDGPNIRGYFISFVLYYISDEIAIVYFSNYL